MSAALIGGIISAAGMARQKQVSDKATAKTRAINREHGKRQDEYFGRQMEIVETIANALSPSSVKQAQRKEETRLKGAYKPSGAPAINIPNLVRSQRKGKESGFANALSGATAQRAVREAENLAGVEAITRGLSRVIEGNMYRRPEINVIQGHKRGDLNVLNARIKAALESHNDPLAAILSQVGHKMMLGGLEA